jgi:hypothetical protein
LSAPFAEAAFMAAELRLAERSPHQEDAAQRNQIDSAQIPPSSPTSKAGQPQRTARARSFRARLFPPDAEQSTRCDRRSRKRHFSGSLWSNCDAQCSLNDGHREREKFGYGGRNALRKLDLRPRRAPQTFTGPRQKRHLRRVGSRFRPQPLLTTCGATRLTDPAALRRLQQC